MTSLIPSHPSHERIDSTKLTTYMECPRKFFWRFLLGLRSKNSEYDLLFGQWYHEAMYHLIVNGYSANSVKQAVHIFNDLYQEEFGRMAPEEHALLNHKAKTPDNVARALTFYAARYGGEQHSVIAAEVPGTVMVSIKPERYLHYICDALLVTKDGLLVRDYKTSGWGLDENWALQWEISAQIGTYHHAGSLLAAEMKLPFLGVEVDGVCFRNPPKTRLDGKPYAGQKDVEFRRHLILRSARSMSAWLDDTNQWYSRLEEDKARLEADSADNATMKAFPKNPTACSHFGLCRYHALCLSRHNPLQYNCTEPPVGFKQEFWDPTKKEK